MGIIAVSDVHLGFIDADREKFKNFVDDLPDLAKRDGINHFVICGDLLDMWRRDMAGVTIENLDILNKLQNLKNLNPSIEVHYLAGNHDYHVRHLTKYQYPFDFTEHHDPRTGLKLTDGKSTYLFKHGYDFEPIMLGSECMFDLLSSTSDEAGEFKSWLYDSISNIEAFRRVDSGTIQKLLGMAKVLFDEAAVKAIESFFLLKPCNSTRNQANDSANKDKLDALLKPFEERMKMPGNGIDMESFNKSLNENEPLVFGHTHIPFHYEKDKKKAINLGSWITTYNDHNVYLEIKDGQDRLLVYPTESEIKKTDVLPL